MGFFGDLGGSKKASNSPSATRSSRGFFDFDENGNIAGQGLAAMPVAPKSPAVNNDMGKSAYFRLDEKLGGRLPFGSEGPSLSDVGKDIINLPSIINNAGRQAMTFGQYNKFEDWLDEKLGNTGATKEMREKQEPKSLVGDLGNLVGFVSGSTIPIGGIGKLVDRGLRLAPATSTLGKLGQAALKSGTAGGIYGGTEATLNGESLPDIAKLAATDAAIFAGGDVALRGAGQLISKLRKTPPPVAAPNTAESFREKVSRDTEKKGTFSEKVDKFNTQFIDDLAPAEKVEKNVRGKLSSAENSLYKTARLFRGSPTRANNIIQKQLKPTIESIESQGFTTSDLGDYALAHHAKDVNAAGIKSGFTDDEINAVITKYGTPEMEAARQELLKYNDILLDELATTGVIDATLPATLKAKWSNYMPLFRSFDDNKVDFTNGLGSSLVNATSPIKSLKGSSRKVIDPLESLIKNTYQSINAAERNKVSLQVAKLALDDTTGTFVKRLAPGANKDRLNTVYLLENGKKIFFEVQPDVYKALKSLDKESSNFLVRLLQKPASLLRAGATLTPEFSFRNPVRDVVSAFVTSKSGFNPITDFPVAFFEALTKGKGINVKGVGIVKPKGLYDNFLADNGGYGNILSMDRKLQQQALKEISKGTIKDKFVDIASGKSLIKVLRGIADTTETATKLGEYRAALRSVVSRPEAAYRARDVMDFSRAGSSVREANKIVAFLNANIQGKSKLIRAFKENPTGFTAKAITSISLPTVGVYLMQKNMANDKQKELIADAPNWLKSSFWLMPIPGTDQVARIPKPFDLAPVFANSVERMMKYVEDNDPDAFDGYIRETFGTMSIPTMITGIIPLIEGMANYSFFRQGPIIPQREQFINFSDQYDTNTSEVAKKIGKEIDSVTGGEGTFKNFGSPRIIDNTIRGLTAGLGSLATGAMDQILESTGMVDEKNKPTRKPSELPIVKALLVSDTGSGQSMTDLYKLRDKLMREKGSAEIGKNSFKGKAELRFVTKATDDIGKITKIMRQVENNPKINSDIKRKRLDELNKRRNTIASSVMERINSAKK